VSIVRQGVEQDAAAHTVTSLMGVAEAFALLGAGEFAAGAAAMARVAPLTAAVGAAQATLAACRSGEAVALRLAHRAPTFAEAMARLARPSGDVRTFVVNRPGIGI
jgi:hypothetical protein